MHDALRAGAVEAVFADGLTLAIWLGGESSGDCCVFKGGPYTESKFFGEGVGIAVRKEDADLRRAMDWALARISQRGSMRKYTGNIFQSDFIEGLAISALSVIAPLAMTARCLPYLPFGSTWPPKPLRIAEMIFSANVWLWRERKRVNSAAESTSAGTASSMAACSVQRPSPESSMKPE